MRWVIDEDESYNVVTYHGIEVNDENGYKWLMR